MKCISIFKCNPQIEVIDKSHCSLEDVPNFQNYSRSLEELFLDANKLTVLNENVFKLTKLRRFSFSDNAIQDIPPDIAKLVNLVELDCSRNKIQLIPEQIKFLRGLQICDFSANNIEYLPSGLVQLKNLTCLTLNYCPIKSLPDDFGLLKSLESLEMRENELESLPASMTSLESLKKLDIGRNLISKLPDDIGRLTKLEYLLVDGNRLETVPSEIGRLKNLQCLDLSQQEYGLKFLPEEVSGLVSLTDLHLSENHLQILPDGLRNLKNLSVFKVDNNYLSELNPSIGGCIALQELVLTSNQITRLPSSIGELTDLRSLNVDSNLLRDLTPQIGNLKSLGILSLRDNLLTHLPSEIGQLELAKVIDLSGNRLEYLPVSITALNLKALWLSKNQAQPLPKLQIDELPNSSTKILTCYLLPQQDEDNENFEQTNGVQNDVENIDTNRPAAVSFDTAAIDDSELPDDVQFVRHDTPHPRELKARHQKLLNNKQNNLKGHDNASFVMVDNEQPYRPEEEQQSSNYVHHAVQRLEYDSNGLPEVPPPTFSSTRSQNNNNNYQHGGDINEKVSYGRDAKYDNGLDNSASIGYHARGNIREARASDQVDDSRYQVMNIVVRRYKNHKPGLGLSIAGGKDTPPFKDNDEGIFVSKVTRGGPAESAGVKVGDKILAVNNNIFFEGITHQRAVDIFKKVKPDCPEFSLRVLRDLDDDESDQLRHNNDDNYLVKGDTFVTSNSQLFEKTTATNSTFTRTYTIPAKADSSSQREPTTSTRTTNGTTAVNNLRQFLMKEPEKGKSATLTPGMSLLDSSSSKNIIYTTLVKDYKHDLGLVLESKNEDSSRASWSNIIIADIRPDSIASRDGKLEVDDRLITINGTDVTNFDLDRVVSLLEGPERFIRVVVSRGDYDDPIGTALRNMPTRPSLGSWFSSTTNMSHRPSLIESYQRPTFGSVNSLQKQAAQIGSSSGGGGGGGGGASATPKPPKPPKPSHLVTQDDNDDDSNMQYDDNPVARPRGRGSSGGTASNDASVSQISDSERRAAWRRERLKSFEDDVEMAKLIVEAQRRRREEK